MEKIEICKVCGNIDTQNPCTVCTDARRDASIIVVVADVADLWALERAHAVNGRYHVLGGTLSPLDGVGPQDLTIDALVTRAHEPQVKEVILALNATVDGQTTAHYITELLQGRQREGDAAGAWRAGRRRTGLSRRRHAGRGDQAADVVLISASCPRKRAAGSHSQASLLDHSLRGGCSANRATSFRQPAKCPWACSQASNRSPGMADSAQIAKNQTHPVASATKPALEER